MAILKGNGASRQRCEATLHLLGAVGVIAKTTTVRKKKNRVIVSDSSSTSTIPQIDRKKLGRVFRPTFSPEHGVLLVLFGSFVTGAALAQHWTWTTTLALVCAFFALQAEHPYVVQIKLRKNLKTRYLLWGGIYGAIALSISIWLWLPNNWV